MSKIEVNAIEPQCGTNLTVGASGDTITFPSGTTVVNNGSQTKANLVEQELLIGILQLIKTAKFYSCK